MDASSHTVLARLSDFLFHQQSSTGYRVMMVAVAAVLSNLLIRIISAASEWLLTTGHKSKARLWAVTQKPKFVTFLRLLANSLTSGIYFVALGLILEECGVNLAAYLASASVIGLAVSFGSQGLVQDTVIGLTLLFSDAMDVGDMVEIVGSAVVIGHVREIGLRFTKVVNLYNQVVFIPNRTIANVSRFPAGGIFAYADVHVPDKADLPKVVSTIKTVATDLHHQFAGIVLEASTVESTQQAHVATANYVRVRFKIWPGQGALIETTFRQRMLNAMRGFAEDYGDWQVAVYYRAV